MPPKTALYQPSYINPFQSLKRMKQLAGRLHSLCLLPYGGATLIRRAPIAHGGGYCPARRPASNLSGEHISRMWSHTSLLQGISSALSIAGTKTDCERPRRYVPHLVKAASRIRPKRALVTSGILTGNAHILPDGTIWRVSLPHGWFTHQSLPSSPRFKEQS